MANFKILRSHIYIDIIPNKRIDSARAPIKAIIKSIIPLS